VQCGFVESMDPVSFISLLKRVTYHWDAQSFFVWADPCWPDGTECEDLCWLRRTKWYLLCGGCLLYGPRWVKPKWLGVGWVVRWRQMIGWPGPDCCLCLCLQTAYASAYRRPMPAALEYLYFMFVLWSHWLIHYWVLSESEAVFDKPLCFIHQSF
jgi:hypothetical protein